MARWNITGVWKGEFWFDPIQGYGEVLPRISFRMHLKQSWLFGSFQGEVWDDPPDGMPDKGYIEGRTTEGGVFFLKRMPIYYVWWNGRPISLDQYLQSEAGLVLDEPPPHPPIKYTGEFRADGVELEGAWEFASGVTQLLSQGQVLEYDTPERTGKWAARRAHE